MAAPPVVAVFNTSPDTVDMLRVAIEQAGLVVVSGFTYDIREGRVDLEAFMRLHRPAVIVYDIAPPYDRNWALFQHLRATQALANCPAVVTSTNAGYVRTLEGASQVLEVLGKPYDIGQIVQAVKEALPDG